MILNFDCRVGMAMYPDNYFDSIVTDPPYELGFMGKKWDASGIAFNVEVWREALRVLKPGGHLLAFSGTRTQHRMVCAIEDAGFEIRDQIGWAYGTGFPKSLDVSKAIDGAARGEPQGGSKPSSANHGKFKGGCSDENKAGRGFGAGPGQFMATAGVREDGRDLVAEAVQWQGWGTALKPAWEPVCVARKPLIGTVAANVLAHGVGALNIDGCRVPGEKPDTTRGAGGQHGRFSEIAAQGRIVDDGFGRWPANIIHDGSDEVLAVFPQAAGALSDQRDGGGCAARFFYCAKASKSDRGEGNNHPTVKPTDLMRYLCRLITPPGGIVLDPFAGSGSTGKGAVLEGFQFIGFDLSPEYCAIGNARIDAVRK